MGGKSLKLGIRSTYISGCFWESKNQVSWIHITITNFEYKFLYRHIVGICIIQTYRYLLRFRIKAISIKQGTGNRENWRTFRHLVTEDVLLKNSIIYKYVPLHHLQIRTTSKIISPLNPFYAAFN